MNFSVRKRRAPVIIIVSLVDILIILLIFFVVSTTFKKDQPEVKINLPESKTARYESKDRPFFEAIDRASPQELFEQFLLLPAVDRIQSVGDGFRRGTALADLDRLRITQRPAAQLFDLRWNRRRKKQRLPIAA